MFQDGWYLLVLPASLVTSHRSPRSRLATRCPRYNTLRQNRRATFTNPVYGSQNRCWPSVNQVHPSTRNGPLLNTMSDQIPFPFNNFTYYFTLFPKFFSSFHHCTCSLSVSRQYLALDGIYHPLRAAFPNNSTLRRALIDRSPAIHGALTLYGSLFQGT